jgi:hypothetical protein
VGLIVYFALIEPANTAMKNMAIAAAPAAWTEWRGQWEYGHAAHFVLHLLGFSMLALSVILEALPVPTTTPREGPAGDLPPTHRQPDR